MKSVITSIALFTSTIPIVAAAVVFPMECVSRIQQIAAIIPGDDGTYSKPSDVKLTNPQLLSSGIGGATGVPYSNYLVDFSVAGFNGHAKVLDSAGSCYISKFSIH